MLYAIAQMEGPCWGHWEGFLSSLVMLLAVVVGVIGSVVALLRRGFRPPTRSIPPPWVLICGAVVMWSGLARDLEVMGAPESCSGGHWLGTPLGVAIAAWFAFANMRLLQSPAGAILWVSGTFLPVVVLLIVINLRRPEVVELIDRQQHCDELLETWGPKVKDVPRKMKDDFNFCVSRYGP